MIFKVPVVYEVCGVVEVEAESKQDLLEKLSDASFVEEMSLPDDPEYIDGSYEINVESYDYERLLD